jgi:hypothetical protein
MAPYYRDGSCPLGYEQIPKGIFAVEGSGEEEPLWIAGFWRVIAARHE